MLLSKTCEYGVRAMLHLAAESPDSYRPVRAISDELNISFHFLTKIFQQLSRAGLLMSYRGPNGGVRLARDASDITLKEIVEAIEGPELFTECVLGLPDCGSDRPCPLHHSWAVVRGELVHMLEGRTLDKLGNDIVKDGLRLTGCS
jgi:Rrf2 family transcriptional regulator, iron-sulfur cluster assembly transcription factor